MMSAALSTWLAAASVSADFRVFEENAPRDPAAEPPPAAPRFLPDDAEPEQDREPAPEPEAEGAASSGEGAPDVAADPALATAPEADPPPPAPEAPAARAPETPAIVVLPPDRRPFVDDHRWLDVTAFTQPGFIVRLENRSEGIAAGTTDDTFWLQRARLGIRAQVFEWLQLRTELELAPIPQLQDAFVDIRPHPALAVRVGQMIIPFLQTFRFNELNIGFLDRAIYVPQRRERDFLRYLNPRDIGVMLHGRIGDSSPDAHDPVFEYQAAMMIGRGPNIDLNDDGVFLYSARLQLHILGVPVGYELENDLARNPFPRATVAFGGYSNCDDRRNWNRGFTVDFEARWNGLFASGAFVWMRNGDSDGFFLADSGGCTGQPGAVGPDGEPTTADFVARGAHFQLQYVLPRFLSDAFLDQMDFELLARIDWVDGMSPYESSNPLFGGGPNSAGYIAPTNYTDADNPPTRWRLTFGLNYYPTGENRLRLGINYQLNREAEDVVTGMGTFRGVSNDVFWIQLTAAI